MQPDDTIKDRNQLNGQEEERKTQQMAQWALKRRQKVSYYYRDVLSAAADVYDL